MKIFMMFLLMFLSGNAVIAQKEYEPGKISDLKGLTKVFIDTDGDLKNKERIVKKIQKYKISSLEIVEDALDAEIVIVFGGNSRSVVVGANTTYDKDSALTTGIRVSLDEGAGAVFIAGKAGKPRLVFRYRNQQETKWEDTPAVKIAAEFIKYYKQANDLK